jgi:HPt (histidine-containing phosphotransfer) domain-containing protein
MIDWARIFDLRDEIGDDGFDEVVELFLEEADEVILQLGPAMAAKPLEAGLHFLKGAALNLGFSALAQMCQDGEKRAAGGSTDLGLTDIKAMYQASKSAFLAGEPDRLSA